MDILKDQSLHIQNFLIEIYHDLKRISHTMQPSGSKILQTLSHDIYSLDGRGIKETDAPPCLEDRARTCKISDAYIHKTIQRVTFNLDCNLEKKIQKVSGYREMLINFNAGFKDYMTLTAKEKLLKTFYCIVLCDQNIGCSCLIEFIGFFFLCIRGKATPKGIFLRGSLLCSIEQGMLKVSTTFQD
jgi:hypothetical protein